MRHLAPSRSNSSLCRRDSRSVSWFRAIGLLFLISILAVCAPVDSLTDVSSVSSSVEGQTSSASRAAGLDAEPPLSGKTKSSASLTVVYTNNIDGEIEPCG